MITKLNQRTPGGGESLSRKKIIIPEIYSKSKEKKKSQLKRQQERSGTSIEYGTDDKRASYNNTEPKEADQLKEIMSQCTNCKNKISQFVTKKPFHYGKTQKSTQTVHKPFLIDLIEERIESICKQNSKMTAMIQQKEEEIIQKQEELSEIEDKFTNIIYSLGQELCYLKVKQKDDEEFKDNIISNSQTPAYIKALFFDKRNQ